MVPNIAFISFKIIFSYSLTTSRLLITKFGDSVMLLALQVSRRITEHIHRVVRLIIASTVSS